MLAKAFRVLFCWIWQENPGKNFLLREVVVRESWERRDAGREARRSRTSRPQHFRAELLLILPPFPIKAVRQYQIRSAISYFASAPMPAAQRLNSFSLKPTSPKRTPTKTKLNINKKQPNKKHHRLFPGTVVATAAHREGNIGLCTHRNLPGNPPHSSRLTSLSRK